MPQFEFERTLLGDRPFDAGVEGRLVLRVDAGAVLVEARGFGLHDKAGDAKALVRPRQPPRGDIEGPAAEAGDALGLGEAEFPFAQRPRALGHQFLEMLAVAEQFLLEPFCLGDVFVDTEHADDLVVGIPQRDFRRA